ncbi:type II toxin-antitoxin system RelE family toxin [Methylomonas koyamae]|uniref:type II toxin-antitoxin system RelE family toxin n=1 Tax=Methylomonas koyamae TaxID=702114 RepID=UPI002872C4C9|nr:type II toxin-antitoxin system RelE/ParE family toxin [Methylomonas koyamae]WNB76072.1 type II toxin-antitoxin system RelE/ParE family toxin [Methylomonas koyamae]
MGYRIEFTPKAAKQFAKLDATTKKRLQDYWLKLQVLDDPRAHGKPLQGPLAGLWRYRVGDYRILARIVDDRLLILVVGLDHRSSVYN